PDGLPEPHSRDFGRRRDDPSPPIEDCALSARTRGAAAGVAMIKGAHAIIYSKKPEADRVFFRDVLRLPNVDVGGGWLIFGLPPAEIAVHPSESTNVHELYLMCDNSRSFVDRLTMLGIECSAVEEQRWGLLTRLKLPGGGQIGIYQPRHARPEPPG